MASVRISFSAGGQHCSASVRYFVLATFCGYLILCTNGANSLSKGQPCFRSQDGATGICRPLSECPDIRGDGSHKSTRPDICEAKGSMPVVCCVPRVDKSPEQQNALALSGSSDHYHFSEKLSISQRKCKQYAGLVYEKQISEETGEIIDRKDRCVKPANPFRSGSVLLGEFSHMAALAVNLSDVGMHYYCGGTLISERYVLTSVTCSETYGADGETIYAALGAVVKHGDSDDARREMIPIVQVIPYPDYESPRIYFDIALLLLEKEPKLGWRIRPACLSVGNHKAQEFFALGWGKTSSDDALSDALLKVALVEAPLNECNNTFSHTEDVMDIGIHGPSQICAGHPYKKSSLCSGDAGGPLQYASENVHCMYEIVGISSFGGMCGSGYDVFSRVSFFRKWIEDVVWPT